MIIKTIKNNAESKLKEKESLFIGRAFQVRNESEAEEILSQIRKQNYDASHNCFAFNIYPNIEKYSDDGEPTGTAGIRLLNSINHFDLTNVLVVSTRYFGGKKLGVGLLGKTYYRNGIETFENSIIIEMEEYQNIKIIFDFPLTKTVHHFLSKYNSNIIENGFDKKPFIIANLPKNNYLPLKDTILQTTNYNLEIFSDNLTFFKNKT